MKKSELKEIIRSIIKDGFIDDTKTKLKEFEGDSNPLNLPYIDTWHEGQKQALNDKTEEAIKLMTKAAEEAKKERFGAGEAGYYRGTIAWLEKKYNDVEKYINDKNVQKARGDEVLKRLLNNKDKSYKEAYNSDDKITPDQPKQGIFEKRKKTRKRRKSSMGYGYPLHFGFWGMGNTVNTVGTPIEAPSAGEFAGGDVGGGGDGGGGVGGDIGESVKESNLKYPMAIGKDMQSYEGAHGWKGKIVYMTPDKYLRLAKRLPDEFYNMESMVKLEKRMIDQLPIDVPVLEVDMKKKEVVGHEGRHRAMVARKLGIHEIPVLIFTGSSYDRVPSWTADQHGEVDKSDFKPER